MIWVKYKFGVIWGNRGQNVIFSKNATSAIEYMVLSALCNIMYPCYHVTHKYALTWDSQLHSSVQGQLGITSADRVRRLWRQHSSYPVGVSDRVLYLTRFFLSFFLSSGNTSKTYIFDMPRPISTKLGHKNPWPMAFMSYDQSGIKGHIGVTGVKKVISLKTLLLLQITGYSHVTHVHASAWPPLRKLSF